MNEEQEVAASFPVSGLDVTCEYGRQPENTTPVGVNVRSYEAILTRERGGSRYGLSRYINELVSGANVIQHLSLLVDPQSPALRDQAEVEDGGSFQPDPSTNNTFTRNPGGMVRVGGSGVRRKNVAAGGDTSGCVCSYYVITVSDDLYPYEIYKACPGDTFDINNPDPNLRIGVAETAEMADMFVQQYKADNPGDC